MVATPIGNLGDITQRALDVLKTVDLVAAEDTRHSGQLLSRLGISVKFVALHEHNEQHATPRLIEDMLAGKSVALITDAGTPAISDPGTLLRGDVLKYDFQRRESTRKRNQMTFNKHRLAVKNIYAGVGNFAMDK